MKSNELRVLGIWEKKNLCGGMNVEESASRDVNIA